MEADSVTGMPWWVTTIVLAFLVNLASTYAAPWFEKTGRFLWASARKSSERSQKSFDDAVSILTSSPALELEARFAHLNHAGSWSGYLTLAALLGFISTEMRTRGLQLVAHVTAALLLVFVVVALLHYVRAQKLARLFHELVRRRPAAEQAVD